MIFSWSSITVDYAIITSYPSLFFSSPSRFLQSAGPLHPSLFPLLSSTAFFLYLINNLNVKKSGIHPRIFSVPSLAFKIVYFIKNFYSIIFDSIKERVPRISAGVAWLMFPDLPSFRIFSSYIVIGNFSIPFLDH